MSVTSKQVEWLYRCVLGREPESEDIVERYIASDISFEELRGIFLTSSEFRTGPNAPPFVYQTVENVQSREQLSRQSYSLDCFGPHDPFRRYADRSAKGRLTIYMPCVHPSRTSGLAKALKNTGHRLMLSDKTSKTGIYAEVSYTPEEAQDQYGEHVSSYREDEFFIDPPDVIFAGRGDNEKSMFPLYEHAARLKPVTLVAMSGIFQEEYSWERYDGVLCCDLPSRVMARAHNVPAIRCAETNWLDDYPASPMPRSDVLYLRSFINLYRQRFPLGYSFFHECCELVREHYNGKVVIENYDNQSRSEVKRLMIESAALFHLKDSDGFGWSVLESLFLGRPVIYQVGLARGMTYAGWMETGISGFPLNQPTDVIPLIDQLIDNPNLLREAHRRTSQITRQKYDGPNLCKDMIKFIEDLHRITRMRWLPNRNNSPARKPEGYSASLDPSHKQDFEKIWSEIIS